MARILYFGRLADIAGVASVDIDIDNNTLDAVISLIAADNGALEHALLEPSIKTAVNTHIVPRSTTVSNHDEIAFLPPLSGG